VRGRNRVSGPLKSLRCREARTRGGVRVRFMVRFMVMVMVRFMVMVS